MEYEEITIKDLEMEKLQIENFKKIFLVNPNLLVKEWNIRGWNLEVLDLTFLEFCNQMNMCKYDVNQAIKERQTKKNKE